MGLVKTVAAGPRLAATLVWILPLAMILLNGLTDPVLGQPTSDILGGALRLAERDDPCQMESREPTAADLNAVATAGNAFACDLYQELREAPGNLFFSPYSISTALAMTYAGARGVTAEEMARVLHFGKVDDTIHPTYARLLQELAPAGAPAPGSIRTGKSTAGYQINIANRLWGQRGFEFLSSFLELTREHYGAQLEEVDFVTAAEAARQTINDWVADRTAEKILDLIPPGVLNRRTTLVLTNAIYFYGKWAHQFKARATQDRPFWITPTESVDVPTMHKLHRFAYASFPDLEVLELPYEGGDLSYLVLLPRERDGLLNLERRLTAGALDAWLAELAAHQVRVSLPKYKLTSWFDLSAILKMLGLSTAFSAQRADFSGMTGRRELYISKVIHKAFVDVQEEGTEAAAATAVIIERTSVAEPPLDVIEFKADHPFLFLIRDNRSGSILFLGRYAQPDA